MILQTQLAAAATFPGSGFKDLPADASFLDRLLYGLEITAIGIAVVFLVLIILWVLLIAFKYIAKTDKKQKTVAPKEEKADLTTVKNDFPPAEDEEEKIVVLATAAIAASRSSKDAAFKVIYVKKLQ